MEYLIKTSACMKPYNCKKWFIDQNYVGAMTIEASNAMEALELWRESVCDNYSIEITRNGVRHRQPMYRDYKDGSTKQVGWVITGRTEFNDDYRRWVKQYIDLWVEIITVIDTEFE